MNSKPTLFLAICLTGFFLLSSGCTTARKPETPHPYFRTLKKPRILYVAENLRGPHAGYRIKRVLPAEVTLAPLALNGLFHHHLCSKPLEEKKHEVREVEQKTRNFADQATQNMRDYDIVVLEFGGNDSLKGKVLNRAAEYLKNGGRLVLVGSPHREGPLAPFAPVKPKKRGKNVRKSWAHRFSSGTDHPTTRGLPLQFLGTWKYMPIYEPADDDCIALSRGMSATWCHRPTPNGGSITYIHAVSPGKGSSSPDWRGSHYDAYQADRPDDSAVWEALYQRLFHWLAYGDRAFPALVKIELPADAKASAGKTLRVPLNIENRSSKMRNLNVHIELSTRHHRSRTSAEQSLELAAGERRDLTIKLPVTVACADRLLRIDARLTSEDNSLSLSRRFTWIPFEHQVQLKVKTEEPVYKSGKKIGTITNLSFQKVPPPGTKLFLGLTDCRGRVLQKDTPKLAASKKTIETVFTMPEGGPERVSSYWITAVCRNGDQILGKSRPVQIQRNDRWGMRRQFQFSVWSRGGPEPYMKLLRDAGFNALGMQGNPATEDQYGIRSYREGLSRRVSTFSVEIKHPTWKETRDWMEKAIEKERQKQGFASRARCLLSLQEEGGFKGGWGRRYYWKEKTAPPVAQKMFAGYLREIYEGDIKTLNREWNVDYEDFDEIPLRKDYLAGRRMKKVNIHAEAWEGGKQTEQKGGERPPEDKTDVTSPYLAHAAPYKETYHFFDWYYQKYCDMAVEVYRKYRNPVPLTICSAPGGFYPKVDVYNFRGQGPFRPKERGLLANTRARRRYGDIPGFGLHWAYFDLRPLWESVLFSSILAGNTHIDYWVDMPLSLNADLTHTRASQWTSELREQLRPIEPILLHKRIRYTPGLGIYGADRESYGALEESGYMPRSVGPEDFDEISVLVAGAKKLDRPAAEKLVTFVRNGGLLISSPQIGSESAHGNPLRIYPPEKSPLTDILGFRLLATSHKLVKKRKAPTIELSIEHEAIPVQNVAIRSRGRDRVMNMEDDIEVVAEYENGDPLILTRKVGRGRVIHLNFMHDWYHWWNTFYEPSREAYRKLIKSILEADGRVKAEHYIGFRSAEKTSSNNGWWGMKMDGQPARDEAVPWWASQLYSDPSGRRRYLAVFSDHRSPIITAKINWEGEKGAVYGLLTGQQITMEDGGWTAQLRPGEARLWAIVPDKTDGLQVELPAGISGAGPLEIEVRPATEKSEAISGCMVDVYGPSGERLKSKSLLNGQVPPEGTTLRIPFADNDPAGKYCLRVTESLTRKTQQLTIRFQPGNSPARSTLCPFPPRADDLWQSQEMDHEDFLDAFRRLREIYLGSYEGLETRYMLSYYLHVPFRPDNRHGIVRDLHRTSWEMHLKVFAEALRAGEKFYLLAEDLNIDPHSGLRIDPLAGADPQRFIERLEKQNGAERETRIIDGIHFRIIRIGEGALIVGQISNDRNIYTPSDYQKWHESLKSAFQKLGQ